MRKLNIICLSIILVLFFIGFYFLRLDDSYIFYKYAKNIADGNGYVFNPGEKINATTSPLYTLLLAFLYLITKPFFNNILPILGNLISISSIVLILYMMRKLFHNDNLFYLFTAVFLAMPILKFGFGMETYLNLAMIILSIFFYTKNKLFLCSIFVGLSVLARFDSVLFVMIIFIHFLISNKRKPPIKALIGFLMIVLPWFIFSKIYFGNFVPTTIAAKLSQHELGLFGSGFIFLTNSVRVIPGYYFTVITVIVIVISSLIYLFIYKIKLFENPGISLILIWSASLFITYAFIINAPPYQWYSIPFTIPIAILSSYVLNHLFENDKPKKIVLSLLFVLACLLPIKNYLEGYNPKYKNFIEAVDWLNKNAKMGSLLAVDDIGTLGYHYNKGKIVDALGLINPEVAEHLKRKDYNWFLDHFKSEFIVHEYPQLQKHLRGDENRFWKNYEVKKVFESRGEKIAIYNRKEFVK